MKRNRTVALVSALLVFLAGAPVATSLGIEAASRPAGASAFTGTAESPHGREAPQLAAVPATHRLVFVVSRAPRRSGSGAKVRALSSFDLRVAPRAGATRVDTEADARLLGASNTPCCARGPPAAA